ncbi:MAG: TSUP family transporter [Actinomycetales bacterium]|nr:TSUP family transporter [Actinomycetales bacterium]
MLEQLSLLDLAVIGICVVLTGVSKTAMPAAGVVSGTVLAGVLTPTTASGFLVPLLVVSDVIALARFRQHVQWRLILRLMPGLVVGFGLMALAFKYLDTSVLARVLGILILLSVAMEVIRRRRLARVTAADVAPAPGALGDEADEARPSVVRSAFFGTLAGMTTMAANAGGTAMTLYLISMRVPMLTFMGTSAWFFFFLNAAKVPVVLTLGLITEHTLLVSLAYLPVLFGGAALGIWAFNRMDQALFNRVALVISGLAGAWVLVHG